MIREWLETYKATTQDDAEQALREVMQEIALAGLQRSGFFEKAAFYGGTALRIFHQLPRFSEDLDFSLLEKDPDFSMQPYLEGMVKEMEALGMKVDVNQKLKNSKTGVDSAFLKPGTEWKELVLQDIIPQEKVKMRKEIKIKIEVDTTPPPGFSTEQKLLTKPFSFHTNCYTIPDLYAGKMHALLFRKWKNRVKGRDWFDMEWYIRKEMPLHLQHLALRAKDSGDWPEEKITKDKLMRLLHDKIDGSSIKAIKEDVARFITDDTVLDIWSKNYFHELVEKIKFLPGK